MVLGSKGIYGAQRRVGSLREIALAIGVLLVPAVLGATFDWAWWFDYLLIVAGLAWCIFTRRLVFYRAASHEPAGPRVFPVAGGFPILVAATWSPSQFSGIWFVAGFAILLTVYWAMRGRTLSSAS